MQLPARPTFQCRPVFPCKPPRSRGGPIRESVDERGKTRPPGDHLITMPFAGRVESIGLIEGQTVIAGQIVARISASDIDAEVAEANTTKGSGVFVINDS